MYKNTKVKQNQRKQDITRSNSETRWFEWL